MGNFYWAFVGKIWVKNQRLVQFFAPPLCELLAWLGQHETTFWRQHFSVHSGRLLLGPGFLLVAFSGHLEVPG